MAWTFKPKIAFLHVAPQMAAHKTNGTQAVIVMDQDGRDMGKDGAAFPRIPGGWPDVKFARWGWVKLITQIAEQAAKPEQAGQGQQGICRNF